MKNNKLIIGCIIFILILWFQKYKQNDLKEKKSIKKFFDKIKLPILVTCLVLVALEFNKTVPLISKSSNNFKIITSQPNF
jgi:hypothetical protein